MALRCVLVVDDDPAMVRMLADGLGEAGWAASATTSAREARTLLRAWRFAAVVSDVQIGDGNGFELLHELRGHPCSVPVILMSAFGREEEARRALADGAFAYLRKPFSFADLVALLQQIDLENPQ